MSNKQNHKEILYYKKSNGRYPFKDWVAKLKDKNGIARIISRLDNVEKKGYYGNFKYLKDGVFELKFKIGYRIYFGEIGDKIVLLLCGGDKGTQKKDIEKAKQYWKEYNDNLPRN